MRQIVENVIIEFLKNDLQLLSINESKLKAHEIAISHRLAVYLERNLTNKGLSVDLEYNKHGTNNKLLDGEPIRPDIVIHSRGNDNKNLMVIEVKKSEHTKKEKLDAINKVRKLCRGTEYKYQYGYVVEASKTTLKIIFDNLQN